MSRFSVQPDGLVAAALLGLLGTAGMFYVNLMPAIVSGLRDALGYSNAEAGYVAAANVYGASAGALVALFLVARMPWKRIQVVALLMLAVMDITSMEVSGLGTLIALRVIHGLFGGVSIGIALAVMARTRFPQRAYGAQFTMQVLLGGVGLMFLPEVAARHGTGVLFFTLGALAMAALAVLPLLPNYPAVVRAPIVTEQKRRWMPLAATVSALFLFQSGNMALFAFIIPLGRAYGLSLPFIDNSLGAANWIAAVGSLSAMWAADRFGRRLPLLVAIVTAVAGTIAFAWSRAPVAFVLANVVTGITWSFVVPYLLGMCAKFDGAGRAATLGGFCSKMGLATGPLFAPLIIGADRFVLLITCVSALLALCGLLVYRPAGLLDSPSGISAK
jgi:MFS transporter, DHA1 family, inner membrane transport protein